MKTVKVTLNGVSPLLINKVDGARQDDNVRKSNKVEATSPEKDAQGRLYLDSKDRLYIPTSWIMGMLRSVGSDYKQRGSKKSLKNIAGCSIFFDREEIYFNEQISKNEIEVDSRFVVVSRGRVLRHRPKLSNWSVTFTVDVEEDFLGLDTLKTMLVDAGKRVGIGDFRPAKGGTFGRFTVTNFAEIESKKAA